MSDDITATVGACLAGFAMTVIAASSWLERSHARRRPSVSWGRRPAAAARFIAMSAVVAALVFAFAHARTD